MIPSSLYIKVYIWSYDQMYHKFSYYFPLYDFITMYIFDENNFCMVSMIKLYFVIIWIEGSMWPVYTR